MFDTLVVWIEVTPFSLSCKVPTSKVIGQFRRASFGFGFVSFLFWPVIFDSVVLYGVSVFQSTSLDFLLCLFENFTVLPAVKFIENRLIIVDQSLPVISKSSGLSDHIQDKKLCGRRIPWNRILDIVHSQDNSSNFSQDGSHFLVIPRCLLVFHFGFVYFFASCCFDFVNGRSGFSIVSSTIQLFRDAMFCGRPY